MPQLLRRQRAKPAVAQSDKNPEVLHVKDAAKMPPRYGISQRPGRLDEAIVSLAARGIARADYVPTKGVTIVKLQRDVTVYFPGDLAVPIRATERPVGAGNTPLFAVFAEPDGMPSSFPQRYLNLLEPALCEPFHPGGMWLIRPDGYTALAAKGGDWNAVTAYLDRIVRS